jgi:2-polyprenyl-3-methyl-5-hydroxy-6-metoxy-1,4-benzoquinol methylase
VTGAGPSSLDAEKTFQADRADAIAIRATPPEVIERYRRHRNWRLVHKECLFRFVGDPAGLRVLDFGCGEGELAVQLAALGARVTGVDVSPELLSLAARRARLDGVADRVRLVEGDIRELELRGGFDVVVCAAVLHHVELRAVYERLLDLLRPGGTMVIQEPIAFSGALQWTRDRMPVEKDVSPDERQLTIADVEYLKGRLDDVEVRYFHLFGRAARLFPHRPGTPWSPGTRRAIYALLHADQWVLSAVPPFRRLAGIIVLRGVRTGS